MVKLAKILIDHVYKRIKIQKNKKLKKRRKYQKSNV